MVESKPYKGLHRRPVRAVYRGDPFRRAITVNMPVEMFEVIEAEANKRDVPLSSYARSLLEKALKA
jgi:hypothetical protein